MWAELSWAVLLVLPKVTQEAALAWGLTGIEGSGWPHSKAWQLVLAVRWVTLVLFYSKPMVGFLTQQWTGSKIAKVEAARLLKAWF